MVKFLSINFFSWIFLQFLLGFPKVPVFLCHPVYSARHNDILSFEYVCSYKIAQTQCRPSAVLQQKEDSTKKLLLPVLRASKDLVAKFSLHFWVTTFSSSFTPQEWINRGKKISDSYTAAFRATQSNVRLRNALPHVSARPCPPLAGYLWTVSRVRYSD